ncbi:hypothetical protein GCM10010277_28760 [Streptomyces longisporoflavus]|uniref:hypothetical protein n=1 Tax=Streptomyces longisporoflavus TaxID=28044 RepID=UPI00199F982C|nr:hypothetical protein [Streptomyces longisporoflavus]GGV40587.1 hypothetical protein GCM10010277_28760 [Streptomyces longisporoflavus]
MERTVLAKTAWRLLPFLGLLYVIAYLDRSNVGFAKLELQAEPGVSATAFTLGGGFGPLGIAAVVDSTGSALTGLLFLLAVAVLGLLAVPLLRRAPGAPAAPPTVVPPGAQSAAGKSASSA